MAKGGIAGNSALILSTGLDNAAFALALDPDYAALVNPLGALPGGPYDYAYVAMAASTPAKIKIDSTLTSLNGLISSGNGRDEIDLSNSTGDNLVFTGNGADLFKGCDGDDIAYGGNGVEIGRAHV